MARSREESSDRGSGPLHSSKITNHMCKPPKNFPKFSRALESLEQPSGFFLEFFGVNSVCFRVPEPTPIYNQHDLMSAVGLNCLIKLTAWMKPRQRSRTAQTLARCIATCRCAIGYSQRSERVDRAFHAAWTNSSASA